MEKIHPLLGWLHFLHVMLWLGRSIRRRDVSQRPVHLGVVQGPVHAAPVSPCLQGVVARNQGVEVPAIIISHVQIGNTFIRKLILSAGQLTITPLGSTAAVDFVHVHA